MSVGKEIRRRRKALKWTLEDLVERAGSDTGNLSRIETGKQGASEDMLRKIAAALGCSVADLFAGGRSKDVTFICKFKDGRKLLATTDSKTFTEIQAACF